MEYNRFRMDMLSYRNLVYAMNDKIMFSFVSRFNYVRNIWTHNTWDGNVYFVSFMFWDEIC